MPKQQFIYYLHEDAQSDERRITLENQGVHLSEEAWEDLENPFYEIGFRCEVDDTGKITILGLL